MILLTATKTIPHRISLEWQKQHPSVSAQQRWQQTTWTSSLKANFVIFSVI